MTHPIPSPREAKADTAIRTTLGLLPVLAISTGMAAPAYAQQANDTVELDTIVVQGNSTDTSGSYRVEGSANQKVLTPLSETPKSIQVITQKEFADRGVTSLSDILRTTPGITLGTGEGGAPAGVNPTIRGNSAANDVLTDGFRSPLRTEYEAFNLESVEITKGPGGTASGTGSTGGTINLTSKAPLADNFADTSLSFGTGGYKRATLDVNRVFGDFGARLNLMAQDADSLFGRDGRKSERYGIAPSFSYAISDATKVTAGLYYMKDKDMLDYGVPLSGTATAGLGVNRGSGTVDDPWRPVDVPTDSYYGIQDRDMHDAETKSAFVRIEHEFTPNLKWSTSLRKASADNAYVVSLPTAAADGVTRSNRQSARYGDDVALNSQLTGDADLWGMKHTFAFGVDIANAEVQTRAITVTNPTGWVGTTPYLNPDPSTPWDGTVVIGDTTAITKYQTRGIYAFDVIDIAPQWQASFGLRYDKYKANSHTGIGTATEAFNSNESSFWNGNVGLVYKPTENGSIYATISSSSNPAGEGNGVGAAASTTLDDLDPERAYNYELGTKWALFDNQLLLTAAVYRTDKNNARQTNEFGLTDNIGKTRSQGFELGAAGQINDKWGISAGYAYTDAKIIDGGYSCTAGVCTPSANNGSAVAGVPRHALSLWTTYAINDKFTVGGGAYFTGKRMLNATRTAVLPSQIRVDLMASYSFNEDTSVQLNANNIFDEQLYSGNRGNGWANVDPGRNFSLTLKHSF